MLYVTLNFCSRFSIFLFLMVVHGCFGDSEVSCAKLWYFWFCIIWACLLIFIGFICIMNKCQYRKRPSSLKISASRKRSQRQSLVTNRQSSASSSVKSKTTVDTTSTIISPQPLSPRGPQRTLNLNKSHDNMTKSNGFRPRPNTPNSMLQNSLIAHAPRRRPPPTFTNNRVSPLATITDSVPTEPTTMPSPVATTESKEVIANSSETVTIVNEVQNSSTNDSGVHPTDSVNNNSYHTYDF